MIQAIESIVSSPIPQLHHRILKCFPLLRGAYATKDKAIDDMLQLSRQRFQKSEKQIRLSALDYFLHRDDQRAEKIGDHLSEAVIRDELFGFLQAVSSPSMWFRKRPPKLKHQRIGPRGLFGNPCLDSKILDKISSVPA